MSKGQRYLMTLLLLVGLFDLNHHFKRRMIKVSPLALADQTFLSQDKVSATDLDLRLTTVGCYSGHLPNYLSQPLAQKLALAQHLAQQPAQQYTFGSIVTTLQKRYCTISIWAKPSISKSPDTKRQSNSVYLLKGLDPPSATKVPTIQVNEKLGPGELHQMI